MLYLVLVLAIIIIALVAYSLYTSKKINSLKEEFIASEAGAGSLTIFTDTCTLLASSRNKIALVEALIDGAKSITDAAIAAVFLPEENGFYSSINKIDEEDRQGVREELERMAREAHIKRPLFLKGSATGIEDLMIVPLLIGDEDFGSLLVANKPRPFTEHEGELLMVLGTEAALALGKFATESAVEGLATRDNLTGLFNHRAFQEKLEGEMERARRFSHSLSLLMIDIDDFKRFNSAWGHEAGDAALRDIAGIIRETIRGIDFAARYGGEEFVVLLVESSPDIALRTAERIREAVGGRNFNSARLTVSIGIATYPANAENKEDLLQEADGALYIAKKRGKDKVISADKYTMA
jgi:diguanylate cyclase (GGDEF)-like protein